MGLQTNNSVSMSFRYIMSLMLIFLLFSPSQIQISSSSHTSQTPSAVHSVSNARDKVSDTYKATRTIMQLYILTFTFLEHRWEDKSFYTEDVQVFTEFNLLLSISDSRLPPPYGRHLRSSRLLRSPSVRKRRYGINNIRCIIPQNSADLCSQSFSGIRF